jgi:Ca2+-binding RTX toxin-like protein
MATVVFQQASDMRTLPTTFVVSGFALGPTEFGFVSTSSQSFAAAGVFTYDAGRVDSGEVSSVEWNSFVGTMVDIRFTYATPFSSPGLVPALRDLNIAAAFAELLSGDDVITASAEGDGILAGAGNDRVDGGPGFDFLDGGAGNDRLGGGLGNDFLIGGSGFDFADYAGAGAAVVVGLALPALQDTRGAGLDIVQQIEGVIGSRFNDILSDNDAANTLDGGAGNDRLRSGLGNDTLIGGSGLDTADYAGASASVAANLLTRRAVGAGIGSDTLVLIENASGGAAADVLTGSAGANILRGNAGADRLTGLAGNDTLDGGLGNDLLIGGFGRDVMAGGAGRDSFDFNAAAESRRGALRDVVRFERGDRIDLSTIDADTDGTAGNQAFRFIGAAAFSGVDGQLRFAGGLLQGDVNGDRVADIEIRVIGAFASADLVL